MPEAGRGPRIEPLSPHHDRSAFSSGVEPLDRYLRFQAGQEARRHIAAPFVLTDPAGQLAGYYTVSATSIALADLPVALAKRLPLYPLVPATLLGRLAVDQRHRGKGYGRLLLADALHRVIRSDIASFAIVVDAKDEAARSFYERESFLAFPEQPRRLFRPVADVAKLFD